MTRYSQKRILIYSHDAYGLGNIRRMLSICDQITKSNPNTSIMLLTGSPMIHSMRIPQNVDYVKLPCITRESTEKFSATYWRNIDVDKMIRIRSDLILSAARSFRPDLIIVDKKPLGVKRELLPTLRFVRNQLPRTKLVLGLRDILDDPKVTVPIWQSHDYYRMIEKYYDQVWIFGSPELFDAAEAYQMPEGVLRKVIYTGYLFKPTLLEQNQIVDDLFPDMTKPMALIMVGGGGDGFPVISAYINGI
ncbi:MAG: glycosyltransferase, partial [Calditrichaeota bacterium]|nr:glycosyltransferase [Calditrichota bacterium]